MNFVWQVIVPVNTRARLRYPAAAVKDIYDDGRVVDQVEGINFGRENGNILMELGSGDYFFSSKLADIKPGPRRTMNDLESNLFNFILYENKKYAITNGPFAQLYGLPARKLNGKRESL